jgi:hypothetical protein
MKFKKLMQFNPPGKIKIMTTPHLKKSIGRSPLRLALLLIPLALVCFALVQNTQAISPAPDGGYPGGNTAEGQSAFFSLTSGGYNTAVGFFSLGSDTTNSFNTAVGAGALFANTADNNTAIGAGALLSNTIGDGNTANGAFALFNDTTGGGNTANGALALQNNTTGSNNTAVGPSALFFNTSGSANIALGAGAGQNVTTASNVICIGANGDNVDSSCYIGNVFGSTSSNGVSVFINTSGRLGTMTSSARFKEDIKPMDNVSQALFALKPVTFRYKKEIDPAGISQLGLVAEEVDKVNPDLVVRDKEGKPYSVRYDQVNAMLLNEFLKEHKAFVEEQHKVQKLEANAVQQQNQIAALAAGLQKMSAQLELSKASPQTVHSQTTIKTKD